ncbi:hypothetical protein [Leptolyngbya sp. FACHB-711]|uniref:hypothetical protein n=1 Tax=Leptolyngbya sp. FACHB-711 TaxID=2692813 RepID=UPI0016833234|nr:hypothetical protein [Leptolyngbya sp. FACHB-711]MBD1850985.1 hypothetical protein [Cyanobacteria bacterium FACHB-502]MBD2023770.1 hypothetical protein [Leptolyngbya sp. FACHB-711]
MQEKALPVAGKAKGSFVESDALQGYFAVRSEILVLPQHLSEAAPESHHFEGKRCHVDQNKASSHPPLRMVQVQQLNYEKE